GPELARHLRPLEDPGRGGAGADRSGRPMLLVVAVGRALTLEVVTSHGPGEALALADRCHVDLLAGREDAGVDLLTDRVRVRIVHPQLDQAAAGLDARAGEMASL